MSEGARNNLYVKDRMERNACDYNGSGIGSGYYDSRRERKEKIKEATLPFVLAGILLICLGTTLYAHISECILKANGDCIMAEYNYRKETATFQISTGEKVAIDARWALLSNSDTQVPVYFYEENEIYKVKVLTSTKIWVMIYVILGGAFTGCIFWIYKELHQSKHSETTVSSGKFND